MKKIFVTREIPALGLTMLRENGFEVVVSPETDPLTKETLISYLAKDSYDGMLSLLTDPIDGEVFDAAPTLKIVANYATGFNNIDIEEAKKRNIVVTNTPGVSALSVAEHTLALILALTARIVEGDTYMRNGLYHGWSPMTLIGTDFSGKTLGLIGVGNIGAMVAQIASRGFGVKVIYYDLQKNETIEKEYGVVRVQSIEELLRAADIVSIHVPLLPSTHHLINGEKLNHMKSTAFLVNTSRGPVVDENALVEALQNKTIAGAGLDVFECEPKLAEGLSKLSNVVLTPHIASARESARNDMARIAAQSIIDFFGGKELQNKVN